MTHQKNLVDTGYWPLYRYDPTLIDAGKHPFHLDNRPPSKPFAEVAAKEARYAVLPRVNPARAAKLMEEAQADIEARWSLYEQFAEIDRHVDDEEEVDE